MKNELIKSIGSFSYSIFNIMSNLMVRGMFSVVLLGLIKEFNFMEVNLFIKIILMYWAMKPVIHEVVYIIKYKWSEE